MSKPYGPPKDKRRVGDLLSIALRHQRSGGRLRIKKHRQLADSVSRRQTKQQEVLVAEGGEY